MRSSWLVVFGCGRGYSITPLCVGRRRKRVFYIWLCLALVACWLTMTIKFNGVFYFGYRVFHVLSYATRPIWDKQTDDNFADIPFFGTSKRSMAPRRTLGQSSQKCSKTSIFFYCEKKPYIMVPKVKKKLKIMEKKFEFLNIFSTFGPVCTVTPRRTRRAWPASWLQDQKSKRLAQSTNATTA